MERNGPEYRFLKSDGAHCRAAPVKPCAQAMTGQPPGGGVPAGTRTTPDAATSAPVAERE